jgi:hypothetical protein
LQSIDLKLKHHEVTKQELTASIFDRWNKNAELDVTVIEGVNTGAAVGVGGLPATFTKDIHTVPRILNILIRYPNDVVSMELQASRQQLQFKEIGANRPVFIEMAHQFNTGENTGGLCLLAKNSPLIVEVVVIGGDFVPLGRILANFSLLKRSVCKSLSRAKKHLCDILYSLVKEFSNTPRAMRRSWSQRLRSGRSAAPQRTLLLKTATQLKKAKKNAAFRTLEAFLTFLSTCMSCILQKKIIIIILKIQRSTSSSRKGPDFTGPGFTR